MDMHTQKKGGASAYRNMLAHHRAMLRDLGIRFLVSIVLTLPILFLSPIVQPMLGVKFHFYGRNIIILVISTIIFLYGGMPFLRGMKNELQRMMPGMMTLIGFAIICAYGYSAAVVFGLSGKPFFAELATLIDIMLVGHWLEMRSIIGTSKALERLALLLPLVAHKKLPNGEIVDVDIAELKVGDVVVVRPGENITADGVVIDGESEVNEAALTGESKPVYKEVDSSVLAGAINGNGALTIEVKKSKSETYLARVIDLVSNVMESKSHAQNLADRAAFVLTLVAGGAGLITFIAWFVYQGGLSVAITRSVTVMISTCPHALGLAIPLVLTVMTSLCAKNGILIRNRTAFEKARKVDLIVFDKTGTLTKGLFAVTDVVVLGQWQDDELLARAASIEEYAKHSLADAIIAKAREKNLSFSQVDKSKLYPGKGTSGVIGELEIFIGNVHLVSMIAFASDQAQDSISRAEQAAKKLVEEGKTAVFVATKNGVEGIIALADAVRDDALEACLVLKKMGIQIAMITGDNKVTAQAVAKKLDIESVLAEMLPIQKAEKIQELKKKGFVVAMVGDGINDAPAIAAADVGMAIGTGTDVAVETADVILVKSDTMHVVDVIKLSQLAYRKMIQNIFWASGYNIFVIPLAAGAFIRWGVTMPPSVGALIMSLSAVIVVVNARLISYKKMKSASLSEKERGVAVDKKNNHQ